MNPNDSEQGQRPGIEGKARKQKYWGLGSTALGLFLESSVLILHIPFLDERPLLIGMVLCCLGLVLLAKAKGQSGVVGIFGLAPIMGPVLGFLSIFIIDYAFNGRRGRIIANYISTVLVLGILAAIAIPNFMNYGARARQSEAKVGLGGIFSNAMSLRSETNTFAVSDINKLGFMPSGYLRYRLWYAVNGVPTLVPANYQANSCDGPPTTIIVAASATSFTAAARGNIDSDFTCDEWSINDARALINTVDDIRN